MHELSVQFKIGCAFVSEGYKVVEITLTFSQAHNPSKFLIRIMSNLIPVLQKG